MRTALGSTTIALAAALGGAAPAAGQSIYDYDYENLAFRGVGIDLGWMWATTVEPTRLYGLRLDLGYLGPGVRILPTMSYWTSTLKQEEVEALNERLQSEGGGFPTDFGEGGAGVIEWSDLSLGLDGHFVWVTPLRVLTYLGAGLHLHALNGQGRAIDDTFVEHLLDSVTAGIAGMAGLEFEPIPRMRVYAEGRYVALNGVQYLGAHAGLAVMFPGLGARETEQRPEGEAPRERRP